MTENNNQLDKMLEDLEEKLQNYQQKVYIISSLVRSGEFKLISKKSRNGLTVGMLNDLADLEEITKTTFRALKKVKRERVPEEVVDRLLGVPAEILDLKDEDGPQTGATTSGDFDELPYGVGTPE